MSDKAIIDRDMTASSPKTMRGRPFGKSRLRLPIWVLGLAMAAMFPRISPVAGATTSWVLAPDQTDNWLTATNWNNGLPTSSVDAIISNGGTVKIDATGPACLNLYLGYNTNSGTIQMSGGALAPTTSEYIGYATPGTFVQSGGTNTITKSASKYLFVGYRASAVSSYTLKDSGILTAPYEYIGYQGPGAFTQSGGTNTVTLGRLSVGGFDVGTYDFQDGVLSCQNETVGDWSGTGTFTQSGGTNTVTDLCVGYGYDTYPEATGTFNLTGGSLSATSESLGMSGCGTMTQSGGTNTTGDLEFGRYSGSSGIYKLNGGTLILSSVTTGSGSATFNFGGGTLQASAPFSTTLPMTLTGIGGNANVNTAGNAVTLSGPLSGLGGLNKLGTNTLTLSGANTYTGNTTVSAGTLALASAGSLVLTVEDAQNSFISVASGAKLDIFGTIKLDIGDVMPLSESWTLVSNSGTVVYEPSFALTTTDGASFTQANDVWSYTAGSQHWTFTEATGVLSLSTVPEPSTFALLGVAVFCLLGHTWRSRKHRVAAR
jgi:fibronectin-binding autotransporter adhesin